MSNRDRGILIIDDDPNDTLLLQRAFQRTRLACPLHFARDGEEAVAYLSGQGEYSDRDQYPLPALVLLDLKMPRKSGLEVLEWIRQQPALKRLIVVMLTSSNQSGDVNRAYELGANSYLVKPAGFDTLMELVKGLDRYWFILNEAPEIGNERVFLHN
ncbi:MAG TPA: response regulator [Verrucomicrobiae bacterium]|nr:response regulator [Verrucomicrobiae bacterium]